MKRGQPYLGAFLLKDENTDSDVITDINSVHPVGVFAQITSVFAATGKDEKDEGLTAVLYPHRRIKITELVKAGTSSDVATATVEPVTGDIVEASNQEVGRAVASEGNRPISMSHETSRDLHITTSSPAPMQTAFLNDFAISVVNVDNLVTQPYNKDDQYIRAFMSEIVSVFKDIAQLNPLFRDQITNFSSTLR